jgi:hypothetical protein
LSECALSWFSSSYMIEEEGSGIILEL